MPQENLRIGRRLEMDHFMHRLRAIRFSDLIRIQFTKGTNAPNFRGPESELIAQPCFGPVGNGYDAREVKKTIVQSPASVIWLVGFCFMNCEMSHKYLFMNH